MSLTVRKGDAEDGGYFLKGNIHVTHRELEALAAIAEGLDNESAAKKLGIRYTTFRNHTYNIMKKLRANNRTEALVKAIENGMIAVYLVGKKNMLLDNYYVCEYCSRAFAGKDVLTEPQEPFIVNHVKYELPDIERCPNDGCGAEANECFAWSFVRKKHPEYPETPIKGAKYDISDLRDEKYKHLEEAYDEMIRQSKEE